MELIIIIAAILVILLMILLIIYRRKSEQLKPNYLVFFITGVCWMPLGIATRNPVFTIVGTVFFIIGITKHKTWNRGPKWNELSPEARKIKMIAIIVLALLVLGGLITFMLVKKDNYVQKLFKDRIPQHHKTKSKFSYQYSWTCFGISSLHPGWTIYLAKSSLR